MEKKFEPCELCDTLPLKPYCGNCIYLTLKDSGYIDEACAELDIKIVPIKEL